MTSLPSTPPSPTRGHAIVIGSSIAGLTAARILADHFERVTLIERDRMPDRPEFRKGVPQGRHAHILLLRGQMILEQLFPGLVQELLDEGAVPVNMGRDVEWHAMGRLRPRYDSTLQPNACSRPLLEGSIYQRLATFANVTFIQETDVLGLCVNEAGTHVTGVQFRERKGESNGANGQGSQTLQADLVVDASGRDSRAPQWLESLGYPTPQETTVNAFPGYATRFYECPAEQRDWKLIYVQPHAPDQPRGAIVVPMEGNRWQVTLIGMAGDYPPTDEDGFLLFARSLPTHKIYDAIKGATPLSDIYGYRRAENRLRHYDNLPSYLENFVVFGDAVYALNPVYGQGMSVAALGGMALDQCLREQDATHLTGMAERFQKVLGEVIALPWQMATGEDQRWATSEGSEQLDPGTLMMQRYLDQVQLVTMQNPAVTEAFYLVQQMIEPPTLFFRPDIVLQVFASMPQMATA